MLLVNQFSRAKALLLLCSLFVLADASSAADTPLQWPHCPLELDDIGPRSLADAVDTFNRDALVHPVGVTQTPITVAETILAIEDSLSDKRRDEDAKTVLRGIRESKTLPGNVYFRWFSRFDDGQRMRGVWWVRLFVETNAPTISSIPIREDYLWSRPYSQMERQQHAEEGLTLINRFVSYFERPPVLNKDAKFSSELSSRLVKNTRVAIKDKNVDQFKKLFVWRKTSQSTRDYVESELKTITRATIHSISFRPRKLNGELLHWRAFQNYAPNIPVVGYVDIVHTQAGDNLGQMKTLTLEVGKAGSKLWFANYIGIGKPNPPRGLALLGSSSRNELLPGDRMLMYSTTTTPGSLLSAHLTNEEVWLWNPVLKQSAASNEATGNDVASQRGQEKSQRLKELFEKLKVGPRLQPSWHARDLPDLYKPVADDLSRFTRRDGILSIDYAIGAENDREVIWLKYLPHAGRFYIEHRFDVSDPYQERVFGPYEGNVYELLPELEQSAIVAIRKGDWNAIRALARMLKPQESDLASRALALIDKSMYWEQELTKKAQLYQTFRSLLSRNRELFSRVSDQKRLDAVQKRLDSFAAEIDQRRVSYPIEEYAVVNDTLNLPRQIDNDLWGEAVKGLRCALVPNATDFRLSDTIIATLVIENVGETDIKISLTNEKNLYPTITLDGKPAMLNHVYMGGFHLTQMARYLVKPKQRVAIGSITIVPEESDAIDSRPTFHERRHTVLPFSQSILELGREYRIGHTLVIGEAAVWKDVTGTKRIYHPAKDEWVGRITTPGFPVQIKRKTQGDRQAE